LPFLVNEIVAGPTCEELMGRSPSGLPDEVVAAVACELGRALQHIHAQGIVHREIKPENIYLAEQGRLVLAEFGIAKAFKDPAKLGKTAVREDTVLLGSPSYMAPEQIADEPATPLSDLFSCGATLYALASGRPPFQGATLNEIIEKLVAVSFVPLAKARPDINPQLAALVAVLLVKNPNARLANGKELARRAALLLAGQDPRDILERYASEEISPRDEPTILTGLQNTPRGEATPRATPLLPKPIDQNAPTQPGKKPQKKPAVIQPGPGPQVAPTALVAMPAGAVQPMPLGNQAAPVRHGGSIPLMLGAFLAAACCFAFLGFYGYRWISAGPASSSVAKEAVTVTFEMDHAGLLFIDGAIVGQVAAGTNALALEPGLHRVEIRDQSGAVIKALSLLTLEHTQPRYRL
jgi:hypothetical protein